MRSSVLRFALAFLVLPLVAAALPLLAQELQVETYTLPNGLTVILHEDHRLPQVTINTWFGVGSKDEQAGRTGFAHLFEHLMFMGTARVPGGQFDQIMEQGGGANNASTATDRTNYYSSGPSSLLPTLLWLDADRLEGLGNAMTKEKVDLQRSVVRNERRQSYENAPYGASQLLIPEALYPQGHPYHHSVIGSHADLEAATLQDVKEFFATYYVPGNATLVVAGDFNPKVAKELVARTFGAVLSRPLPARKLVAAAALDREIRIVATDKVKYSQITLIWHSPRRFDPGNAEMDLVATLFSDGSSGRLQKRLVLEEKVAQDVAVFQYSKELGSEFRIVVKASEGANLEKIKRGVLDEIARFQKEGPTQAELARAKAVAEASLLRTMESLDSRADSLNMYHRYFGEANGFKRDLARYSGATSDGLRDWARDLLGEGRLDLRVLPLDATVEGASLDQRPADLADPIAEVPRAEKLALSNGVPLYIVRRPGAGLFTGILWVDGGERLVPAGKAGLSSLVASLLTKGAGGRNASAFAEAAAGFGASVDASSSWHSLSVQVSGLTSKMGPTLDLFADSVLRPTLSQADFDRERDLALAAIRARSERPIAVASLASRVALFGRDDPRGRPVSGYASTVAPLTRAEALAALPALLDRSHACLIFAGDVEPSALKAELDKRFHGWKSSGQELAALPEPLRATPMPKLLLVDRPGAPQTVINIVRPRGGPSEAAAARRDVLDTLFGMSFTSRLNQNLREKNGFSYGAKCSTRQEANQVSLLASSSVQTPVTGKALTEFKREFDAIATGNVSAQELEKARKTVRFDLLTGGGTSRGLAYQTATLVENGRPADALARELGLLQRETLDSVNAEASAGAYDWKGLLVVLVGDKAAVLPQLEGEGFPTPELADTEGNPVGDGAATPK